MPKDIFDEHSGVYTALRVTDDGDVLLLHCAPFPYTDGVITPHSEKRFRLLELQAMGENQNDHHGNKHTGCNPGYELRYAGHETVRNAAGPCLRVTLEGAGLTATYSLQFYDKVCAVRAWVTVKNTGSNDVCLTYLSSFALTGLAKGAADPADTCYVSWAYNSWCCELQWRRESLAQLGLAPVSAPQTLHSPAQYQNFSLASVNRYGRGTWSCSEYLPVGVFENTESSWAVAWQVENNGPWQWELSTIAGGYYLQLAGPDDERHHWRKTLRPGQSFTSVPAALAFANGGREAALAELTQYRRRIIRPCADNTQLPVIFNDYMALLGDPTEEKLLPLIDAAANAGGEYFCVDAGWYADDNWWDSVGLWQPEGRRFPHGLPFVMQYIRSRGMIPGLWLEIEVMGVRCPLAETWPDACFFMRGGKRVIDHARYQLDFRHPIVLAHANEVVDRLVRDYGVGYIKMDYNINGGYGTEQNGESAGDGLMGHAAAYLAWIRDVQRRYPEIVIENCASGGMRMDYVMLSLLSVQSLSDQDEAARLAPIAAAAPSAVTPEQAACWSLPQAGQSEEEMILSMVNTLLLRIHQSGDLDRLSPSQLSLLREAVALYKTYRREIPSALPFWPLGLPQPGSETLCLGLDFGTYCLVAVWCMSGTTPCRLPLPRAFTRALQYYPAQHVCPCSLSDGGRMLEACLPAAPSARLYRLE